MARFDLTRPVPILLLSDGPDQKTGLGRICHDLARLLSTMPEFKVGVLGRNSMGRTNYPWTNYSFGVQDGWGQSHLLQAWSDLSRGQRGIVLTVWDATRLVWFTHPETSGLPDRDQRFLGEERGFERWGYFMQDCDGIVPHRLPQESQCVMAAYDRVLTASRWAWEIVRNSLAPAVDLDWMPHGINLATFQPRDRMAIRSAWGIGEDETLIGCCMANQDRKHWATVMEAVASMSGRPRLWIKTDRLLHYWNLQALAIEYGLVDRIVLDDRDLTDADLAWRYSACDATVMVSGGEGFCYPVAESLACGVPAVSGAYGAQTDLTLWTFPVSGWKIETIHNVRRAYYDPLNVGKLLEVVVREQRQANKAAECRGLVEHLGWERLAYPWKRWIRKGLQ